MNKEKLLKHIISSLDEIDYQIKFAEFCEVDNGIIEIYYNTKDIFIQLKEEIEIKELLVNYLNLFATEIQVTMQTFEYRNEDSTRNFRVENKFIVKRNIETRIPALKERLKILAFNLDFFQKLNYFNNNIVAVGTSGSGKTTLANHLKKYLPNNGVVISAQRVLIIPTFSGISNIKSTSQKLSHNQKSDKTYKTTYTTENNGSSYSILSSMGDEFKFLLDNMLAERSASRNKFCDDYVNGIINNELPITNLDKSLLIWNFLIQHKTIECIDGINITLKSDKTDSYPAYQMSDGEKVTLYLIAQVLQAPKDGFIIVDEPEIYLHKTILNKLWDILEKERLDCIFIYLTHDLDFATTRSIAKKVWIKSYTYPDVWEIENIPTNDLPEALMLELLGSRKNILFCEGRKGGYDEKIYNILFPNYTITPVESCFSVINFTRAFNKIKNITIKAFGIIDSDYHDEERLNKLKSDNIFSLKITEIENLLLDEDFLKVMASKVLIDAIIVETIKKNINIGFFISKEIIFN